MVDRSDAQSCAIRFDGERLLQLLVRDDRMNEGRLQVYIPFFIQLDFQSIRQLIIEID